MSESSAAVALIPELAERYPTLELLWVDGSYATHMAREVGEAAGVRLEVVPKEEGQTTFKVLRRRWVVERTFAWLMGYRRLRADYETTDTSTRAWIYLAIAHLTALCLVPGSHLVLRFLRLPTRQACRLDVGPRRRGVAERRSMIPRPTRSHGTAAS